MLTPGGKNVEYSEYLCGIAMEFLRLYGLLRLSLNSSLASITIKKRVTEFFKGFRNQKESNGLFLANIGIATLILITRR